MNYKKQYTKGVNPEIAKLRTVKNLINDQIFRRDQNGNYTPLLPQASRLWHRAILRLPCLHLPQAGRLR
jgi:hypothetical protein